MKKNAKIFKKNKKIPKILLFVFITAVMIFHIFSAVIVSADKKVSAPETVFANTNAKIDFTEANKTGIVKVNAVSKTDVRIKVTITKNEKNSMTYTYNLKNDASVEAFPLQMGDGEYIVRVWHHEKGTTYRLKLTAKYYVGLLDQYAPYLSPNQYINFNKDSKIVKKAEELTKNSKTDLEKVEAIYKYVINHIKYDTHKAATVQEGYLPEVDAIIDAGKGICFDYAAVLTAMLRSQGIPAKLAIGYVKDINGGEPVYHAWTKFYLDAKEFTINAVKVDRETNLIRVDPTFDAGSNGNKKVLRFVSDDENYNPLKKY